MVTYVKEFDSLSIKSLILITSELSYGADRSTIKRFFFEYFPSAMPIGDILKTSKGGSLKGPKRYPLLSSVSINLSTTEG